MAQLSLTGATAPTLTVVDGIPTTTSIEVARHFGKPHDEVLRRIRNLLEQLPDAYLRNFAETETERPSPLNGAPIKSPAYRITRDGFTLLAMGFTGQKALGFKLAYIDAFNRLERELHERPLNIEQAMAGANLIAARVQVAVFKQLMEHGEWAHERWLLSFNYSRDGAIPAVTRIDRDALVMSVAKLARTIPDPALMLDNTELANLAAACTQRLARRLNPPQAAMPATFTGDCNA